MVSTLSVIAAEQNWLIMLPFGILLLAIAFGPLIVKPGQNVKAIFEGFGSAQVHLTA